MNQFSLMSRRFYCLLFFFASYALQAQTIYLTPLGAGDKTGSSWENAAPGSQLQNKINVAPNGSQIWVAAGTYLPNTYPAGCNNCGTDTRNYTFHLKNNIKLYGGFLGTEKELNKRNIQANPTILSGDIGIRENLNDNSYHVIFSMGYNTCLLNGFTITDGNADNASGTMYIIGTGVAQDYGGGMYNDNSPISIENCTFTSNNSLTIGGGIFSARSNGTVTNCKFLSNTSNAGAGMYSSESSPALTNCLFFKNNARQGYGGGITLTGYTTDLRPLIINCTFVSNYALAGGGGINTTNISPVFTSCIFWNNSTLYGDAQAFVYRSIAGFQYCDIQGGYTGPAGGGYKNIDADPLFVEMNTGDLRLTSNSPAINKGLTSYNTTSTDLGGNQRKYGLIDIGAYEYQGEPCSPPSISSHPLSVSVCEGTPVSFTVTASGTNLSYKWKKDGKVVGGNLGEITITDPKAPDAGAYTVEVSGDCGTVTSNEAQLTVNTAPAITSCPGNISLNNDPNGCGATVNYSPVISGSPAATVSYTFSGATTGSENGTGSGSVFNSGITNVTITARNSCFPNATCSFTVTVTDNIKPTITAPARVTATTNSGCTATAITLGTPVTADNCGVASVTNDAPATFPVGSTTVTWTVTDNSGNTANAIQTVIVTAPEAPVITVVNNCGSSILSTTATGTLRWSTGAATSSITVTTSGTYTVTQTVNGCTSTPGSGVALPVCPVNLSVSYMDGDYKQLTNNNIRPYLQLNNEAVNPVAYKDVTIRYWLTVEDFAPMANLFIDWAQLGTNKVKMKYVKVAQPLSGAFGYIEYSFDASAGNLAARSNSGPIQSRAGKSDWTNFNEGDDYSYTPNNSYAKNSKITVYQNGTLVWGTEPTAITTLQRLKAYSQDMSSGANANSIGTYLKLNNEGNKPVSFEDITMCYWFTADGQQALNYTLDYAVLGGSNIKYRFVKLTSPVAAADTYLELSFTAADSLYPISSTGNIQQRINKSDWSMFTQLNDHSYKAGSAMGENTKVTVYVKGTLVYGVEPANVNAIAAATVQNMNSAAPESDSKLTVKDKAQRLSVMLLNNPVRGSEVEYIVRGAEDKHLQVTLLDAQGRLINAQQLGKAGTVERQRLSVKNSAAGILFLRVSTHNEVKTIQVMRAK